MHRMFGRFGFRSNNWLCNSGRRYFAEESASSATLGIKEQAGHVRLVWRDGAWGAPEWLSGVNSINLHLHASCLHYGGGAFEGFKAFEFGDGSVHICNAAYNAERMNLSAARMNLPEIPPDVFLDACCQAVQGNRMMVPSYKSGESLYIRPVLLATGAILGIKVPCPEFTFFVTVQPLGAYMDPAGLDVRLSGQDRAAPRGTGAAKVPGNYGCSVAELHRAFKEGYADILFVDPLTRTYIDEFHGAQFLAVSASTGAVVSPMSNCDSSLHPSTRRMLLQLAEDDGLKVENRLLPLQELLDGQLSEVAATGTAYVVCRIRSTTTADGVVHKHGELQVLERLRERLVRIQRGEEEDKFGWMLQVPEA